MARIPLVSFRNIRCDTGINMSHRHSSSIDIFFGNLSSSSNSKLQFNIHQFEKSEGNCDLHPIKILFTLFLLPSSISCSSANKIGKGSELFVVWLFCPFLVSPFHFIFILLVFVPVLVATFSPHPSEVDLIDFVLWQIVTDKYTYEENGKSGRMVALGRNTGSTLTLNFSWKWKIILCHTMQDPVSYQFMHSIHMKLNST